MSCCGCVAFKIGHYEVPGRWGLRLVDGRIEQWCRDCGARDTRGDDKVCQWVNGVPIGRASPRLSLWQRFLFRTGRHRAQQPWQRLPKA